MFDIKWCVVLFLVDICCVSVILRYVVIHDVFPEPIYVFLFLLMY